MDEQLRAYLDGKFAVVDDKFAAINGKFAAIDKQISDVRIEIERVETSLLSEFWKWGRATDQRMRRLDSSDATTVDRITNVEARVFALERRIAGSPE